MAVLYWKSGSAQTSVGMTPSPFDSEMKFEEYLFKNPDLLEDMFILGPQVRTGSHEGVLDMVGVDQDNRVCLIELKNQTVTDDILPQVLGYATWAESNPDSIKNLWLQSTNRPEGQDIDWDSLDPRIVIAAPSFAPSVARMAAKIGYDADLFQIQRFEHDGEEFLLVGKVEQIVSRKPSTTGALQTHDREFYESRHGKLAVDQFLGAVAAIESFARDAGWSLETKYNKYYAGFKYGNRVCFGVQWDSTHLWSVIAKVPKAFAASIEIAEWQNRGYEDMWKQVNLRPASPASPGIKALEGVFHEAYRNIVGA